MYKCPTCDSTNISVAMDATIVHTQDRAGNLEQDYVIEYGHVEGLICNDCRDSEDGSTSRWDWDY